MANKKAKKAKALARNMARAKINKVSDMEALKKWAYAHNYQHYYKRSSILEADMREMFFSHISLQEKEFSTLFYKEQKALIQSFCETLIEKEFNYEGYTLVVKNMYPIYGYDTDWHVQLVLNGVFEYKDTIRFGELEVKYTPPTPEEIQRERRMYD